MLSVTLVGRLFEAILFGEMVEVAPAGKPEVVKVIAESLIPMTGLTIILRTAVSPSRTVCDGVLPPKFKLKGRMFAMVSRSRSPPLPQEHALGLFCEHRCVCGVPLFSVLTRR